MFESMSQTLRDREERTVLGRVSKTNLQRQIYQAIGTKPPARRYFTYRDGIDDANVGDGLANDG